MLQSAPMTLAVGVLTVLATLPASANGVPAITAPTNVVAQATEIAWEEFEGQTNDGATLAGQRGRISVPENRSKPDGKQIEIEFVRFKSTNPDPGPPLFFLIGGPGVTASGWAASEASTPNLELLTFGDFIAIDQRGTGNSPLNSTEPGQFSFELPLDEVATREARVAGQKAAMAACYEHWTDAGFDLAAYNSSESADDVEAVRAALGYEKITLWGTSYGSHLSLAYLRRHAEHVARAVLMKVEGPDQTFKLPSNVQAQLEKLSELVAADASLGEALPDLVGTIRSLRKQLDKEPVEIVLEPPGRDPITILAGTHDFDVLVAMQLGFTEQLGRLPAILHGFEQGEWTMLGMAAINLRRGGIDSPMAMMMDASSGASKSRLKQFERERKSKQNLIGDALNFNHYPEASVACGSPDVGEDFRGPLECDVPVLFVSGSLDARTPPSNVEEIIGTFSKAAHVVVENTGHDARELQSAEYCELVRNFLGGEAVESQVVELPPIQFTPLQSGR